MIIYLLVFSITVFLMYLYQYSENKSLNILYLYVTFSLLFLLLALRVNTGADYNNYINIINEAKRNKNYLCFEIGWAPLIYLMTNLNIDSHFFFVITSFISTLLFFKIVPKSNICVGVCIYLALGYIESFSITRQCFAAMIFTYGYSKYIRENNVKKFFLLMCISVMFHKSFVIILLLTPFILLIGKSTKIKFPQWKVNLMFLILFVFFSTVDLGDFILNKVLANTSYAVYGRMGEIMIGKTKKNTGLGMLLRYILCFSVSFNYSVIKENYLSKKEKINNTYILILYSFFLLSNQISIFMRLPLLLDTSLIAFYDNKDSRIRRLQNIFMILICSLLFFATLLKSSKNVDGSWKLIPYTSIIKVL